MDKPELIASYKYEKDRLAKVEKALEIQKKKLAGICRELLEQHGKGPHDIGDGNTEGYIVIQKGETCYLSPSRASKKAANG
jgi:hypothetical protein